MITSMLTQQHINHIDGSLMDRDKILFTLFNQIQFRFHARKNCFMSSSGHLQSTGTRQLTAEFTGHKRAWIMPRSIIPSPLRNTVVFNSDIRSIA